MAFLGLLRRKTELDVAGLWEVTLQLPVPLSTSNIHVPTKPQSHTASAWRKGIDTNFQMPRKHSREAKLPLFLSRSLSLGDMISINILIRIKFHPKMLIWGSFPVYDISHSVTSTQCRGTRRQRSPTLKAEAFVSPPCNGRGWRVAGSMEGEHLLGRRQEEPCWQGRLGLFRCVKVEGLSA